MTTTTLRTMTIDLLKGIEAIHVYDSKSDPLADASGALPAVIVETPTGQMIRDNNRFTRRQVIRIVGVVEAPDDAIMSAGLDALELAVFATLLCDEDWNAAWSMASWDAKQGLSSSRSSRLRGVTEITLVGSFDVELPDPSDLAALHEIRAYTVPADQEIPEGEEPEQLETRVPCAGAEE